MKKIHPHIDMPLEKEEYFNNLLKITFDTKRNLNKWLFLKGKLKCGLWNQVSINFLCSFIFESIGLSYMQVDLLPMHDFVA